MEGITLVIVLDTNILFGDWWLRNAHLKVLFQALTKIDAQVYIPQVVIDELLVKHSEALASLATKLGQQKPEWDRLFRDKRFPGLDPSVIETEKQAYKDRLLEELDEAGAQIWPYPSVPHDEIIDRLLKRSKPFASEGKGYRDYLIWKSILEIVDRIGGPVTFISKNTNDFAAEKGEGLHAVLLQDVLDMGHSEDTVVLQQGLDTFVDVKIKPKLEFLSNVMEELGRGDFLGLDIADIMAVIINDKLSGREFRPEKLGLPSEYGSPTFDWVDGVEDLTVADVRELPSGELLIEAIACLVCDFDVFISKSDYWLFDEDELPNIRDHDWNEYTVRGGISKKLRFRFTLVFNPDSGELTSWSSESEID